MKTKEIYEQLMHYAHMLEEKLDYDETKKGRRFGKIVNKLQKFKLKNTSKKLTIKKQRFLDWYFYDGQDDENEELRYDLAKEIIDQLYKKDVATISIQKLFDNSNHDSIKAYFTEEFDQQTDEYDIELSELDFMYELTLID